MLSPKEAWETVEALTEVLDNDETEIKLFQEALELQQKIQEIIQKQQALMKRDINTLCSMVEEQKEKMANDADRQEYHQKEKDIKSQMDKMKQLKTQVQQECQSVQEELTRCQREESKLVEEKEAEENKTTKVLPNIRYDLNMYNMICRIRWKYDCGPDEVSGYVCNKKEVKPFTLSTKQNSQFFITNYLWDLIEDGVEIW
ncbi:kinetochore protein spc24-like isoform X2 [Liolophura sinensis]